MKISTSQEEEKSLDTKRFKNLQKCEINLDDGLIQPEEYAQTVQDGFQNSATRVKICIYFRHSDFSQIGPRPQLCKILLIFFRSLKSYDGY